MRISDTRHGFSRVIAPLALVALLGACGGKKDDADLANLDAQLTNNAADPALRAAVESNITVDPDLVGQSNRNAIRPANRPHSGAVLSHSGKIAANGDSLTLGGLARKQKAGRCGSPRVQYANSWAQKLPATFPLYPGAALTEAAGADNPPCALRAVSFTTGAAVQDVLNFYYAKATGAGYSAERRTSGPQEILGGTHGDHAFYITVEPVRGGGSSVDLIVNSGA